VGAKTHPNDECLYIFTEKDEKLFIGTHVDDLFFLCSPKGKSIRDKVINTLKQKMTVEEKGEMTFALDVRIQRDVDKGLLKLSQREYIENLLKSYDITTEKPTPSPLRNLSEDDVPKSEEEKREAAQLPIQSMIGKLWWLALISRPDIYTAVHQCACWQQQPSKQLVKHIRHIMEYLNHTKEFGIIFQKCDENGSQIRVTPTQVSQENRTLNLE
jgi:hypothetical protein